MNSLAIHDTFAHHEALIETATRKVYVVDDNTDVRRSLFFSLAAASIVVWPFSCAQDLLDQCETLSPAPILIDVRMPKINGLELLSMLRERGIDWPVVMMSAHGDIPTAVQALQLGAVDFLEKPFNSQDLEKLLNGLLPRLAGIVHETEARSAAKAALERLSMREAEVMQLLVAGARNREVAIELNLSVRTVEHHRSHAMAKLGVRTLSQVTLLQSSLTKN